jgi:hypothetical protein
MPGAFNGTASSTISQMEKMLRVFSPLTKNAFPGGGTSATFECAKLGGPWSDRVNVPYTEKSIVFEPIKWK